MKKILGLIAMIAFTACSSAPKETTVSTDVPVAQETAAKAEKSVETVKTEVKKEAKKAVQKVKEETAKAETAATDATASAFGAINGTEKSSVTCTNKGETRKITIMSVTEGGCGVVYNKAGADKTVAMAKSSMDYCDTVSNKMKTNLEGAGFDCGGGAAPQSGSSSDTEKK